MLDVELERGRTACDCALQTGLGEEHVDAALRVAQRLDDRSVRTGLSHAADVARAGRDDHPRLHAVGGPTINLKRATEPVGPSSDNLGGHHAMAEGTLEVER